MQFQFKNLIFNRKNRDFFQPCRKQISDNDLVSPVVWQQDL